LESVIEAQTKFLNCLFEPIKPLGAHFGCESDARVGANYPGPIILDHAGGVSI